MTTEKKYKCPECNGKGTVTTASNNHGDSSEYKMDVGCSYCEETGFVSGYLKRSGEIDALNDRIYDVYCEFNALHQSLQEDLEKESDPMAKDLLSRQIDFMAEVSVDLDNAHQVVNVESINMVIEKQLEEIEEKRLAEKMKLDWEK